MLEALRKVLEDECLLSADRPVLVGVSGGPDSLSLAHALHRLRYTLIVAHLDHALRETAGEEAEKVRAFAAALGVPFRLAKEPVAAYAESQSKSVEEAARELRYRFLFAQAEEDGAQAVAVGHTADDQVETVLMHLLRGAGLDGLKGMQPRSLKSSWSPHIPLVRPFLSVWRDDILAYCEKHQLQPVFDRSNLDTSIYRNRLRHELIPYLESYNPQVRRLIWRTARTLAGDRAVVEEATEDGWRACIIEQGQGWIAISREGFEGLPLGVQRGLVRRAMATMRPHLRDVDFLAVERALEFIARPPDTKQRDLTAGLRLLLEGDRIWLARWEADLPNLGWPQVPPEALVELPVPGKAALGSGWILVAEQIEHADSMRQEVSENTDPFRAWADEECLEMPLVVRGRRPGDRFQPLGMGGHSLKLADFLINAKLPGRARDGWPLVCAGEQIVWVPGYRLAHPYRLRRATRRAVKLSLVREDDIEDDRRQRSQ